MTKLSFPARHVAGGLAVATALGIAGGALPAAAQETETVRIGHWSWPGYGFYYVAEAMDLAPGLEFEYTIVEDPVQLFGLLSTGQLDIVLSTIEFGPIAAAEDMPVKLAALTNLGYGSDRIIVHPDIGGAEDLRGETVAVLEGGLSQIYMAIWLEQNGVAWDEVDMVNLIAGDAAAAMISGQVAAAELWDPFGPQVLAELDGSRELSNSKEPYWLELALIADAVFVADSFIEERGDIAVAAMDALFAGVEYWRENPTEANTVIAEKTGFSMADVEGILGGENNPEDGALYMYTLEEAARFCGVAEGDPPFGQSNGQMAEHWSLTNEWWMTFGLMTETVPPEDGVDCSLLGRAYAAG
ncbi:MAG: ABC transporter substrate-binding protein [Azospirillaceae bacterium]